MKHIIYYKKNYIIEMFLYSIFGGSLLIYTLSKSDWLGIIFTVIFFACYFYLFVKSLDKKPQLIIDSKGLETPTHNFISWNKISKIREIENNDRGRISYALLFHYNNQQEYISLKGLDKNSEEIFELVRKYHSNFTKEDRLKNPK